MCQSLLKFCAVRTQCDNRRLLKPVSACPGFFYYVCVCVCVHVLVSHALAVSVLRGVGVCAGHI